MATDLTRLSQRFWSKVDKSGTCWLWRASKDSCGYGRIGVNGRTALAHRVAYELAFGPIEDGKCVCHICDIPACVRPAHLFMATQSENLIDCYLKGRKPKGEANGNAKLSTPQVHEIRRAFLDGKVSQQALGRQYGVSGANINFIVRKKTWTLIEQEA